MPGPMSRRSPSQMDGTGFWYTLWTASKLLAVLLICVPIALLMVTSSQPTAVPTAAPTPTPTGILPSPTPGTLATAAPTPKSSKDTTVPGTLIYVQGRSLMEVRGAGAPVRLLSQAASPAISPDGRKVAYIRFQKNFSDLLVLDLQTGKSIQLTQDGLRDPIDPRTGLTAGSPAWSDDGSSIYFTWNYPGFIAGATASTTTNRTDLAIYRCAATGPCAYGSAQDIADAGFTYSGGNYDPAPRPTDPSLMVYSQYTYGQGQDLALPTLISHDITTTTEIPLTGATSAASEPAWAPNGRYLAFIETNLNEATNALYVMQFHSPGRYSDFNHAVKLLQGNPLIAHPVFSPDGKYLAYVANDPSSDGFHLYVARIHLGPHTTMDTPHLVAQAGIVDSDQMAWMP